MPLIHADDLSKIKGYSTMTTAKGSCFGAYNQSWIFEQYLFYKLQDSPLPAPRLEESDTELPLILKIGTYYVLC
jgi:hypothetical protein